MDARSSMPIKFHRPSWVKSTPVLNALTEKGKLEANAAWVNEVRQGTYPGNPPPKSKIMVYNSRVIFLRRLAKQSPLEAGQQAGCRTTTATATSVAEPRGVFAAPDISGLTHSSGVSQGGICANNSTENGSGLSSSKTVDQNYFSAREDGQASDSSANVNAENQGHDDQT